MSGDFVPFPKIGRLSRHVLVTEKIDGTNASIVIGEDGSFRCGSRTRWITPENDNYGFARWAYERKAELMALGVGRHFGEWWGLGIQRNYGLHERRFSLFNVTRWNNHNPPPPCCHVVPVLCGGNFDTTDIDTAILNLKIDGSKAAPGFNKPEGVVVFHTQTGHLYKKTIENDDAGKGFQPQKEIAA